MTRIVAFFHKPVGLWSVIGFILAINCIWYFSNIPTNSMNQQQRKDASGFSIDKGQKFAYFNYYTGNFPLATLNDSLVYSEQGALNEIKTNGKGLIMEYQHWSRLGEHARIWAFLPDAWLKGSPKKPSIKTFNALLFIIALISIFISFYRINKPVFGALLVLIVSVTPFFVYEVYGNENIFGLLATVFLICLSLNLPVLFNKTSNLQKTIAAALISGVFIGFFSEFRNELSILFFSILLIYLFANQFIIWKRLLLISLTLLTFWVTKSGLREWFDYQYNQTVELVAKNNGHVYTGKRIEGHKFWHPVFCGLGDFDRKYGYVWNDRIAYEYATPILNNKYDLNISYSGELHTDNYYDTDSLYYIKFDEIEAYETVVRDKVISDIKNDPIWYLEILGKRLIRILSATLPIPFVGWLLIPLSFLLIRRKEYQYLKLIVISLPLSLSTFIIYSDNGSTYNSLFGYFILIISLLLIVRRYSRAQE